MGREGLAYICTTICTNDDLTLSTHLILPVGREKQLPNAMCTRPYLVLGMWLTYAWPSQDFIERERKNTMITFPRGFVEYVCMYAATSIYTSIV